MEINFTSMIACLIVKKFTSFNSRVNCIEINCTAVGRGYVVCKFAGANTEESRGLSTINIKCSSLGRLAFSECTLINNACFIGWAVAGGGNIYGASSFIRFILDTIECAMIKMNNVLF